MNPHSRNPQDWALQAVVNTDVSDVWHILLYVDCPGDVLINLRILQTAIP